MTDPAKKCTKKFKFFKFKGFGSLSNLPRVFTFRRTSSSTPDQGLQNLHTPEESAFENTQDDLTSLPRSPSYARSSDMYSHMGTMPRTNSNRMLKPVQVQSVACKVQGPQTPQSPTTTASLLSPEIATAAAYTCQSLDSNHTKIARDLPEQAEQPAGLSREALDQNCLRDQHSRGTESQTGEPIPEPNLAMDEAPGQNQGRTETAPRLTTKTHLSTKDAADGMEDIPWSAEDNEEGLQPGGSACPKRSHQDELELGSEYVKFSKEKYILDSSPEKLHKELEEELKLNSTDLRSHAWYHGRIPREVSESLVQRNGDFLIRDSLTSLGDYVLSCRWKNEPLHFKINKVMVRTTDNCTRIQYLFEQESFDNIPALVRFYVGNRHAVSEQSGAVIYCPINRTFPLRYLEASYGLANGRHGGPHSPSSHKGGHMKRRSITMTDGLTADKITRGEACPNSISSPHHRDAIRNCAVSVDQIHDMHVPMSPISETPGSPAYSTVTRLKPHTSAIPPASPVLRRSSEPQICPENNNKPDCAHSVPCHGYTHTAPQVPCYPSTDTGHYCQLRPASPAGWERPTHDSPSRGAPHKSYVERLRGDEARLCSGPVKDNGSGSQDGEVSQRKKAERDWTGFVLPTVEMKSAFNPALFKSTLIPLENKPLEMTVLKKVKELLAEADAKTIAGHITKADCLVARILAVTKEMQRLMGVGSGMELLTLPHGRQLRLDLLERFHTMSIMIAVDILGCTGSTEERAAMLHKTIQLAAELKSTMGNMFSFAAVMNALEMSQISRLEQTWMGLRQRHTEGAILYEKKLKPFLKGLNEGKEGSPLTNTTFPHIVPLITLLERDCIISETGEPWESIDGGVEVVMAHLEAARMVAHHGGLYRTNAEMKLHGFQEKDELMEVFSTEFQMRLLWGSRGAESSQAERYEKFDKVLTALSHKLEPSVRFSEL